MRMFWGRVWEVLGVMLGRWLEGLEDMFGCKQSYQTHGKNRWHRLKPVRIKQHVCNICQSPAHVSYLRRKGIPRTENAYHIIYIRAPLLSILRLVCDL